MPEPLSQPNRDQPARVAASPGRPELEDQRLIALVIRQDLAAFDTLYRAYHPRLLRFLDRIMGRPTLVDELINQTMWVVWTHAERYDGTSKVSTWIFGIAYRNALKALRELDEPVDDAAAESRPSEEPGPEQAIARHQVRGRLLAAMNALSAEHRAVIDLSYFHGADYREIAQIVDCPVATVKTRMFHARRHLRALLAAQLGDWI